MGDENSIRTLGDYSKPSHEGYRNTIELPVRNNLVPLRSDTIQLVQKELLDLSTGLSVLNQCFPVATAPKTASNCTEDCKVKFATGTLTEEALSWWNSFAQPIRIEKAYNLSWVEFNKLLIKKIEGKKPSELILSTQLRTVGMLETCPCVEDVDYITQDLAVLCVIFATRWATRPSSMQAKEDQVKPKISYEANNQEKEGLEVVF
nr:reverse transcriptase domain-containing protein [Tanacetum cinerariifolium]